MRHLSNEQRIQLLKIVPRNMKRAGFTDEHITEQSRLNRLKLLRTDEQIYEDSWYKSLDLQMDKLLQERNLANQPDWYKALKRWLSI